MERFSGIRARVERQSVGTKRLRFRFEFDSYHAQWNHVDPYRRSRVSRSNPASIVLAENFEPTATIVIAQPLTWTFGVSFQQMQMEYPGVRNQAANSVESTLRFHKGWEDIDSSRQVVDAAYTLRAATKMLDQRFCLRPSLRQGSLRGC